MSPAAYDVAVVGGGPARSATATWLARGGLDVVLLERDLLPRHKLCGEFLSGEARRLLDELGCLEALLGAGARPIEAARFTTASGGSVRVDLPSEALGVSACGSSFKCSSAGLPLASAFSNAGANSSVCRTVSPCAPYARASAAKSGFLSSVPETRSG